MTISIKDFDIQEVCIWLNAIGLGTKVGPFRENAVDGDLLCSLSLDDLTGDLGLSGLQVRCRRLTCKMWVFASQVWEKLLFHCH